jgi:transposase-like protein
MAQHFLHSASARNLAKYIFNLSEDQAELEFAQARWGSKTKQGCPRCGVFRRHYRRRKRRRWRCAECGHEFSATSGTLLHKHKLSFRELLHVLFLYDNGAKGQSLLEISRHTGHTPKTIQALVGKFREFFVKNMDLSPLKGTVHMDGGYFGGKPRKERKRRKVSAEAIRIRYGKKTPKTGVDPWVQAGMSHRNWLKRANKRVVMSMCESGGALAGSQRVIAIVCPAENEATASKLAEHFIAHDARVMTDESPAYSQLFTRYGYEHYPVCHSREYSTDEGVSDNMSETFFSRFRRAEYGCTHGFRPKYLQDFACEYAWRENHRRHSQMERLSKLLTGLLTSTKSEWWCGYWQGHYRRHELGMDYFLGRLAGA